MRLVDLHVPTSRRSLELNPDLRSLAATQATRIAAGDLHHCAAGASLISGIISLILRRIGLKFTNQRTDPVRTMAAPSSEYRQSEWGR